MGDKLLHLLGYREDALDGKKLGDLLSSSEISARAEYFSADEVVNVYVDPVNGSDDNLGMAPTDAFKTYQRAADDIPDGFKCHVLIRGLAGASDETSIVITARPGSVPANTHAAWADSPSVMLVGDFGPMLAGPYTFDTSNGADVVDDGITKQCQRQYTIASWGFALVEGEHVFADLTRLLDKDDTVNTATRDAVWPVPARSVEATGSVVFVQGAATAPTNRPLINSTNAGIYSIGSSSFSSAIRIVATGEYPVYMAGFKFTGIVYPTNVSLVACSTSHLLATFSPRHPHVAATIVSNYVGGLLYARSQDVFDYSNTRAMIINNVHKNSVRLSGQFSEITGLFTGGGRINETPGASSGAPRDIDIARLHSADFETATFPGIELSAATIRNMTAVSFQNVTSPFILKRHSYVVGGTGVAGKGSAASKLETGSFGEGLSNFAMSNTTTIGQELQVGANAAIAFSGIGTGKHDFAVVDTSQGCRTT